MIVRITMKDKSRMKLILPDGYKFERFPYEISRKDVVEVTLPEEIVSIGDYAFHDMPNLKEVHYGTLEYIGVRAFAGCRKLHFEFREGLRRIEDRAFEKNRALTEVEIPSTVEFIDGNVFEDCLNVERMSVSENNSYYSSPGNCNAIVENSKAILISGCRGTVLPDGISEIGFKAFRGIVFNSQPVLPETLRFIGERAFMGSGNTGTLVFNRNLQEVKKEAFYRSDVKAVLLSEYVVLRDGCFRNCTSLEKVTVPDTFRLLPKDCFRGCSSLKSLRLPDGIFSIGPDAFSESGLVSLTLPENCIYIKERICRFCKNLLYLTLSPRTQIIGDYAFSHCESLEYISFLRINKEVMRLPFVCTEFPESLRCIGTGAFEFTAVREMDFQNCRSMKIINPFAFQFSRNLRKVTFSESIYSLGESCFSCCGIRSLSKTDKIRDIGHYAFFLNHIESVNLESAAVIGVRAFADNEMLEKVVIGKDHTVKVWEGAFEGTEIGEDFLKKANVITVPYDSYFR